MNPDTIKRIFEEKPAPFCRRSFIDTKLCMFCDKYFNSDDIIQTQLPINLDYHGTINDKINAIYMHCMKSECMEKLANDLGCYLEAQFVIPVKYPFQCNRMKSLATMSKELHIPSTSKPMMYCGGINHIIIDTKNLKADLETNQDSLIKIENYLLAYVLMEKGTLQKTIPLLDLFRNDCYIKEYICSKEAARQNRKLLSETKPFLEYYSDKNFDFKLSENYQQLVDYVINSVNKLMFQYKQYNLI